MVLCRAGTEFCKDFTHRCLRGRADKTHTDQREACVPVWSVRTAHRSGLRCAHSLHITARPLAAASCETPQTVNASCGDYYLARRAGRALRRVTCGCASSGFRS